MNEILETQLKLREWWSVKSRSRARVASQVKYLLLDEDRLGKL